MNQRIVLLSIGNAPRTWKLGQCFNNHSMMEAATTNRQRCASSTVTVTSPPPHSPPPPAHQPQKQLLQKHTTIARLLKFWKLCFKAIKSQMTNSAMD